MVLLTGSEPGHATEGLEMSEANFPMFHGVAFAAWQAGFFEGSKTLGEVEIRLANLLGNTPETLVYIRRWGKLWQPWGHR